MNFEFKFVDVVAYAFIIGVLIYFVIQIGERNKLIYLNAQLRLKNCNVPEESFSNVIEAFLKNNYTVINNVGDDLNPIKNTTFGDGLI